MRKGWLPSLAALLFSLAQPVWADLIMNVTLDYDQDRDRVATQSVFKELASRIGKSVGQPVRLEMTQHTERVGEQVRIGAYDILVAPSHLIGLAMRHGYVPVSRTQASTRVALLATKASGIAKFEQAKGRRAVLPHQESLVTTTLKGELNAMGLSTSGFFGPITTVKSYGAVIYALDIGQAEVAALREETARQWLAGHPGASLVKTFDPMPVAGVAVQGKMDPVLRAKIGQAFTGLDAGFVARLGKSGLGAFAVADAAAFEKISTRGFYTPEVLPGVTIVTAAQVKKMMDQKVPLYDVRPVEHYREGHIPGAISVHYQSNSPKEPDFDDAVDRFDLSKLPQDKQAPMIFQCNGAECWYSYKAARYMARRGFTKVYWYRTGLPAWKAAGYPIERGG